MATRIRYGSAKDVAHAVRDELTARGREPLTARPYQYQRPDASDYWVIPSSDWPAYPHGKLVFTTPEPPSKEMFCGLYVEKGLDPKVAAVAPGGSSRRIMPPGWRWHAVIADLGTPKFEAACAAASRDAGPPLLIEVDSHCMFDAGDFDDDAPRPRHRGRRVRGTNGGPVDPLQGPLQILPTRNDDQGRMAPVHRGGEEAADA